MSLRSYHHDVIVLGVGFMVASTQRDLSSAFPVCRLAKKTILNAVPFPGVIECRERWKHRPLKSI